MALAPHGMKTAKIINKHANKHAAKQAKAAAAKQTKAMAKSASFLTRKGMGA
jgi:hypothetical protein